MHVGENMNYFLYHSSCYDGFGAAYSAWKCFGNTAEYIPVSHGKAPPIDSITNCDTLYIVDFSYKEDDLIKLKTVCNKIVIIDHHVTAEEHLSKIDGLYDWLEINFDMTKSGAYLTWEYFFKNTPPILIQHISDRDLWEFKLEGTHAIHKALVSYPMDFELWESFKIEDLLKEGKVLSKMYDNLIEAVISKAWVGKIAGCYVPMVNTSMAWSEVGHRLLELNPKAEFVASFTVFEEDIMWSLRSRKNGFNVANIAKMFGGGGHRSAAGFKTTKF